MHLVMNFQACSEAFIGKYHFSFGPYLDMLIFSKKMSFYYQMEHLRVMIL